MDRHNGIKYKCYKRGCDKEFSRQDTLQRHRRKCFPHERGATSGSNGDHSLTPNPATQPPFVSGYWTVDTAPSSPFTLPFAQSRRPTASYHSNTNVPSTFSSMPGDILTHESHHRASDLDSTSGTNLTPHSTIQISRTIGGSSKSPQPVPGYWTPGANGYPDLLATDSSQWNTGKLTGLDPALQSSYTDGEQIHQEKPSLSILSINWKSSYSRGSSSVRLIDKSTDKTISSGISQLLRRETSHILHRTGVRNYSINISRSTRSTLLDSIQ
jgi:hypothetical protein